MFSTAIKTLVRQNATFCGKSWLSLKLYPNESTLISLNSYERSLSLRFKSKTRVNQSQPCENDYCKQLITMKIL